MWMLMPTPDTYPTIPSKPCHHCGKTVHLAPGLGLIMDPSYSPITGEFNPDARFYCGEDCYQAGERYPVPAPEPRPRIAYDDEPTLTREMLRDIIDLRIAIAFGMADAADRHRAALVAAIVGQGKPLHVGDEYGRVFTAAAWKSPGAHVGQPPTMPGGPFRIDEFPEINPGGN